MLIVDNVDFECLELDAYQDNDFSLPQVQFLLFVALQSQKDYLQPLFDDFVVTALAGAVVAALPADAAAVELLAGQQNVQFAEIQLHDVDDSVSVAVDFVVGAVQLLAFVRPIFFAAPQLLVFYGFLPFEFFSVRREFVFVLDLFSFVLPNHFYDFLQSFVARSND